MRAFLVAVAAILLTPVLPSAAASAEPLPRLHATHGKHAAIRDQHDAQVLLHGINVNQLGEYFQADPDLAPVVPIARTDFRDIARLGFNTVRLVVSWSALEPTPGAYDEDYVARIRQAVRWAASYDLYVVLDMHQDAYGIAVDTPLDETCPDGTHPNNGWDGAPAWATITDDASTCTTGERELAPAVRHAWQNFFDDVPAADGVGVQTHLVDTWGRLAEDFARVRNVAGYDLLNEPGFGYDASNSTTDLGRFYARAITAIRAGEDWGYGYHHIVFWEPSVLWSALGSNPVPDRGFSTDKNLVFAPHIYAESLSPNPIPSGFTSAQQVARQHGVTVWGGEYGFWPTDPADAADTLDRYAAAEDAHLYGGAWWDWKQACGNPHVVHQPGGEPDPVSPSLNRYTCPDQVAQPIDPAFGDTLSRPTARAVPGTITRLTSDGRAGTLDLKGTHAGRAGRCALRVFVPARFADARVRTEGIRHLKRSRDQGNVVLRGCVADSFRLRVG
ncbi:glycoside hydrolase family 5 protein [Nocardioides mangrovi]|uniref:Glycoside hydrolase family 5 protein n=1 Tax=Nocardioides mangrovi TaxID=2874580 RepID=A0ABS7UBB9_9ACTN|nr:cellulase family glycosylhydrolase [Nocardioides mangrovi]MBZ5738021.1 glycoside hydrolase family 5 protein [Nocardioides mangrovi]